MARNGFRAGTPNSAYIGEGVTVKGAIFVPDRIVVDGIVEGDVTAQSIQIGASGAIKGKVVSTDLDVSGQLGEHTEVKTLLVIRASARVEGHVNCGDFEVERGAVLAGGIFSIYDAAAVSPMNDNDRTEDTGRPVRAPKGKRKSPRLDAAE